MKSGIYVISSKEVFESQKIALNNHRVKIIYEGKGYKLGNFKVTAFNLFHDVPCLGFHIWHKDSGNILFITDSFMCEHRFDNVNHVLIEANYADDILINNIVKGSIPALMKPRLMGTHLELESAKLFLRSIANPDLQNIILIHLSNGNSDEARFVKEITQEFGVNVVAGDKNITVSLDLIPY